MADQSVLYDLTSGTSIELRGAGSLLWQTLDEPTSLGELGDDLADAFDEPADEVWQGTVSAVRELVGRGFVEVT